MPVVHCILWKDCHGFRIMELENLLKTCPKKGKKIILFSVKKILNNLVEIMFRLTVGLDELLSE